ncbi:MAG TPA: hypothetical protein PLL69_06780 [Gemmatimonadales bacterium]|nr:hypothetical protein [Gemmatimonadales bacterium]
MLRVFVGTRLPSVLAEARRELGEQACIVDVTCSNGRVEVMASEIPLTMHPFQAPRHPDGAVRTTGHDPDPSFFGAAVREPDPGMVAAPAPRAAPVRTGVIRR